MAAKTFLSNKVRKAIDNITGNIIGKNLKKSLSRLNKINITDIFNMNKQKLKYTNIINNNLFFLTLNFSSLIFSIA
jgi:hypothetical protein